ncbi:MAG TPA: phage holin family protein [Flavisolibacter sp.]
MGFIIKVLVTGLAVFVADYFLDGVHINDDVKTVIIVALVLALLNTFIKPVLVILTIPVTILTLGLFLLIINALMVIWADKLIEGFTVDGWWSAILFSLIVSIVSAILNSLAKD